MLPELSRLGKLHMITIPLTKGYAAFIDDEDADLATHRYWASVCGPNHVYAQRYIRKDGKPANIMLHREVAARMGEIPPGYVVDHKDGNTLNCRRSNLRSIPHKQNIRNVAGASKHSASGILGVNYRAKRGNWRAYIVVDRKYIHLGTFGTVEEATEARAAGERLHFGVHPRRAEALAA